MKRILILSVIFFTLLVGNAFCEEIIPEKPYKILVVSTGLDSITSDPALAKLAGHFYEAMLRNNEKECTTMLSSLYKQKLDLFQYWLNLASDDYTRQIIVRGIRKITFMDKPAYELIVAFVTEKGDSKGEAISVNIWQKEDSGWKVLFLEDFHARISVE